MRRPPASWRRGEPALARRRRRASRASRARRSLGAALGGAPLEQRARPRASRVLVALPAARGPRRRRCGARGRRAASPRRRPRAMAAQRGAQRRSRRACRPSADGAGVEPALRARRGGASRRCARSSGRAAGRAGCRCSRTLADAGDGAHAAVVGVAAAHRRHQLVRAAARCRSSGGGVVHVLAQEGVDPRQQGERAVGVGVGCRRRRRRSRRARGRRGGRPAAGAARSAAARCSGVVTAAATREIDSSTSMLGKWPAVASRRREHDVAVEDRPGGVADRVLHVVALDEHGVEAGDAAARRRCRRARAAGAAGAKTLGG